MCAELSQSFTRQSRLHGSQVRIYVRPWKYDFVLVRRRYFEFYYFSDLRLNFAQSSTRVLYWTIKILSLWFRRVGLLYFLSWKVFFGCRQYFVEEDDVVAKNVSVRTPLLDVTCNLDMCSVYLWYGCTKLLNPSPKTLGFSVKFTVKSDHIVVKVLRRAETKVFSFWGLQVFYLCRWL